MLPFVLLYIGFGTALAGGTLAVPALCRPMATVATRLGISLSYARTLWTIGTIIAWPVGLYVLATGRLVLVNGDPNAAFDLQSHHIVADDGDETSRVAETDPVQDAQNGHT